MSRILRAALIFVAGGAFVMAAALGRGAYVASTTGWERIIEHADFSPRDTADGAQFAGYLWLSNGYFHGAKVARDLWRSRDGRSWEMVNGNTPYEEYALFTELAGKLVAVRKSAWESSNGTDWQKIADIGVENEFLGSLAVMDGAAYLVDVDNVWKSIDGRDWTMLADKAPFGLRNDGSLVALNGRLLYLGGSTPAENSGERGYANKRTYADVWASTDGREWTRIVENAPWKPRIRSTITTRDDLVWMFGGYDNVDARNLGDLWVSDDGESWTRVDLPGGPSPRHYSTAYPVEDGILIVAGNAWPVQNDVWLLRPPRSILDVHLRAVWLETRRQFQKWFGGVR